MRLALALLAAFGATAATGQDAPAEMAPTPTEGQNFAADTSGALRIVGDENRYDIVLPADILFDFDESTLRPDAQPLLDQLSAHFAGVEPDQVHVRGHTDSKGTAEYNYTLSIDRATAVCDWLRAEAGLEFTNCIGRGEDEPLVPNENADGSDNAQNRQLNRRVTISVVIYPDVDAMLDGAETEAEAAIESLGEVDTGAMMDDALDEADAALEALGK